MDMRLHIVSIGARLHRYAPEHLVNCFLGKPLSVGSASIAHRFPLMKALTFLSRDGFSNIITGYYRQLNTKKSRWETCLPSTRRGHLLTTYA
jgi:hypothetical protein